jgi:hypothetical protein
MFLRMIHIKVTARMQASAFEFLCVTTFGVFSIAGAGAGALEQGQE